jgi:hypothetical protein
VGTDPTRPRSVRHSAFVVELAELAAIEPREARAIDHAQRVFEALGRDPGYPLTSAVRGSRLRGLRELRPRAGRSRFRVLFVDDENVLILLALAPEARRDPRGFRRAVRVAEQRRAETT